MEIYDGDDLFRICYYYCCEKFKNLHDIKILDTN